MVLSCKPVEELFDVDHHEDTLVRDILYIEPRIMVVGREAMVATCKTSALHASIRAMMVGSAGTEVKGYGYGPATTNK